MQKIWDTLKVGFEAFCRKNHFDRAILGLSGGIDSALCAVLAAEVLGGKNVTALMMCTQYTSALSLDIAKEVAALNGLNYHELDIQLMLNQSVGLLQNAFGQEVKGLVIENLQARIRGQILMSWSNQFGGLVLACGNKSEAATGYCTLYGDTCGGLMPIGDLYKTEVFALAKWLNEQKKVLPESVITRAPSAELAAGQQDSDSLPPYESLDEVLKLYIDQRMEFDDIIAAGCHPKLTEWVLRRYDATAFKRLQMPPKIKLQI